MTHPLARRDLLRTAALVTGLGVTASACTSPLSPANDDHAERPPSHEVVPRTDGSVATVVGDAEPSIAASRATLARATAVVVSTPDDESLAAADAAARALGLPLLVEGGGPPDELDQQGQPEGSGGRVGSREALVVRCRDHDRGGARQGGPGCRDARLGVTDDGRETDPSVRGTTSWLGGRSAWSSFAGESGLVQADAVTPRPVTRAAVRRRSRRAERVRHGVLRLVGWVRPACHDGWQRTQSSVAPT